ncbi:hypothetical protein [Deinococcus multiflagellatus]|uniref:Uncharacterized protein n=1 Tax=Deinococcus multiflagellatus TaxID=1656887 RepID=A0ABW1ZQ06_9DEIO|nr:hypothetical protein [Deinococcus multiflagellatus]MBZ9713864.1 hypothetical protein [Deinococcus multiflagellatus]
MSSRLLSVALLLGTGAALAASPVPAPDAARREALEVGAQNTLRRCVVALAQRQLDSPTPQLPAAWEGRSCAQAVPELARLPFASDSVIRLRPATEEGFEVTLTSASGRLYRWPLSPTPLPPPPRARSPLLTRVMWVAGLGLFAAALALLAAAPGSRMLAGLGLVLGGLNAVVLRTLDLGPLESAGAVVALSLVGWLTLEVLGTLPRAVLRAGQEAWWVSLGSSLFWAMLLAPFLAMLALSVGDALWAAPGWTLGAAALTVLGLSLAARRRRHRAERRSAGALP